MRALNSGAILCCLATVLMAGCSGGQPSSPAPSVASAPAPSIPKRMVAATVAEPTALRSQLSRSSAGSLPGTREIEQLVSAGLSIADDQGRLLPELAESVPSVENGLWRVFPDGRMETTWKIRQGARWQDGHPFTADDLVFTAMVSRDRDLLLFRDLAFDAVDSVTAPDAQTVVVQWSKPWIQADSLFGAFRAVPPLPLPQHLLASAYADNKAGFADLSFWTTEFVGSGPYRVKDWQRGSSLTLTRVDDYVLGQPKIDEIDVRFIQDASTLIANVLAGEVELPLGINLSFEDATQLKDQWAGGTVQFSPSTGIKIWPQFRNPNPPIVADVRFRRALLYGLDRQQMADSLMAGQSTVADSSLVPREPAYDGLQPSVVRYPYDPRQAMELIAALGYVKGPDDIWRDASGQRLSIEVRTIQRDILIKSILSATDYWKRIGIDATPVILNEQQRADREFYATYPAFDSSGSSNGVDDFITFHSSQAKTAENRYSGSNRTGYANPELDAGIDQYFSTIPLTDRLRVAGQIVHHLTDQVVFFPLFYELSPTVVASRLTNVPTQVAGGFTGTWNAQQWDVRS